jgi:putative flippase GtrA
MLDHMSLTLGPRRSPSSISPPVGLATVRRSVDHTSLAPVLDVVVPVYNEEHVLGASIERLRAHLASIPYSWRITIVDNASTDDTWLVAAELAHATPEVRAIQLDRKGRGLALRHAWSTTDATVATYTDVDLSTGLDGFLPLVAPLISEHSDIAIGSRLARGSRVERGWKREVISRSYNLLLRSVARARFSDAQCGFKAIRVDVARQLLPLVENDNWFFDTELLLLAERNGLRVHEVPVDWVDDPDSRVDIVATAAEDIRGLVRVGRRVLDGSFRLGGEDSDVDAALGRQALTFAAVGAATTIIHLGLFSLWSGGLGNQAANALALVVATIVNTFANGWLAFGKRERTGWLRPQLQAGGVFLVGLAATATALGMLGLVWPSAGTVANLAVVAAANAAVTLGRFVAMRSWIFHPGDRRPTWRPVSDEVVR